jgi:hypothetical protein
MSGPKARIYFKFGHSLLDIGHSIRLSAKNWRKSTGSSYFTFVATGLPFQREGATIVLPRLLTTRRMPIVS